MHGADMALQNAVMYGYLWWGECISVSLQITLIAISCLLSKAGRAELAPHVVYLFVCSFSHTLRNFYYCTTLGQASTGDCCHVRLVSLCPLHDGKRGNANAQSRFGWPLTFATLAAVTTSSLSQCAPNEEINSLRAFKQKVKHQVPIPTHSNF